MVFILKVLLMVRFGKTWDNVLIPEACAFNGIGP